MKKLILGFAISASYLAFAQEKTARSPLTFGAKAGLNISSLSKESGVDNQKSKVGFNVGGFVNIPLSSKFSLQPEVLFSQYGDKYDRTIDNKKYSFSRNLNYIAVPVMFQYNALPNLYLEAGPEFGVALNGNVKSKNGTPDNIVTREADNTSLNRLNIGLGIGAGYYFTPNFGVTARYVAGLSEVRGLTDINDKTSVRNNVFQIGIAYKFK